MFNASEISFSLSLRKVISVRAELTSSINDLPLWTMFSCGRYPIVADLAFWILPLSGDNCPVISLKSDVLPVPFAPTKAILSPEFILNDTSLYKYLVVP